MAQKNLPGLQRGNKTRKQNREAVDQRSRGDVYWSGTEVRGELRGRFGSFFVFAVVIAIFNSKRLLVITNTITIIYE